jgi:hypothetical protein
MMQPTASGPDPVDGLHLALLQRRADEVRKQLDFRTFSRKEGLLVAMLICGIVVLSVGPSGSRTLNLVLGWTFVVQAALLYWSLRQNAAKELQRLTQRIAVVMDSPDGKTIEQAAVAARELLLRK